MAVIVQAEYVVGSFLVAGLKKLTMRQLNVACDELSKKIPSRSMYFDVTGSSLRAAALEYPCFFTVNDENTGTVIEWIAERKHKVTESYVNSAFAHPQTQKYLPIFWDIIQKISKLEMK
jgi:hypothetical protein